MSAPSLPGDPACQQHDPELWQSEPHSHMQALDRKFAERATREAKRICVEECPILVRLGCLRHALEWPEPTGVWGGMDVQERNTLIGRCRDEVA